MKRLLRELLALLVLYLNAPNAWSAGYSFTNIADTTTVGPYGVFSTFGSPAVSGNTVAFAGGGGIFTGNGGPLKTIVKFGDFGPAGPFGIVSDPAISGDTVAFFGAFGDSLQTSGIFMGSGGPITTVALERDPAPIGTFYFFDAPAISGNTVAFSALYGHPGQEGGAGVFTGSGGPLTPITQPNGPSSGPVGISGNTVVFGVSDVDISFIYAGSGGPLSIVVGSGDPAPVGTFRYVGKPSISGDNVAFEGGDEGDGFIFRSSVDGSVIDTIARGSDAPLDTFFFVTPPTIGGNDVAFLASYANEEGTLRGEGVFIGNGGPLNTVIRTGDALFGSAIESLFVGIPGFNLGSIGLDPDGSGNLAFKYELADGRRGIALASPIPEPNPFALAGALIILACLIARIRPRSAPRFS